MLKAKLFRFERTSTHTLGALVIKGKTFYIIERPWLDNASNVSCIPSGTYRVDYLAKSASGRYRKVWHVKGVQDRFGILIHKGNYAKHSKGCLIIGSKRGWAGNMRAVWSSAVALRKFNRLVNKESFELEVI